MNDWEDQVNEGLLRFDRKNQSGSFGGIIRARANQRKYEVEGNNSEVFPFVSLQSLKNEERFKFPKEFSARSTENSNISLSYKD